MRPFRIGSDVSENGESSRNEGQEFECLGRHETKSTGFKSYINNNRNSNKEMASCSKAVRGRRGVHPMVDRERGQPKNLGREGLEEQVDDEALLKSYVVKEVVSQSVLLSI